MEVVSKIYKDVSVFSVGKKLNVGSYLTRNVIFDGQNCNERFSLSIIKVCEDGTCEVMPYKAEIPSTVQLDTTVIIRPGQSVDT